MCSNFSAAHFIKFVQLVCGILSLAFVLAGLPIEENKYPPVIGVEGPALWITYTFIGLAALEVLSCLVGFVTCIRWNSHSKWTKTLVVYGDLVVGILLGVSAAVLIAEYVNWRSRASDFCVILNDLCMSDMKTKTFSNYDLAMAAGPMGLVAAFLGVTLMISAISRKGVYTRAEAREMEF